MGFSPPTLNASRGWYIAATPVDTPDPEAAPKVIASNVPIADQDMSYGLPDGGFAGPGWPTATLASLPMGGVVIVASLSAPDWRPSVQGLGDFKSTSLPLRLTDAEVRTEWEAQPNPRILQLLIRVAVNDRYVEVKSHFGSLNPPTRSVLAAQALLDSLEIPSS